MKNLIAVLLTLLASHAFAVGGGPIAEIEAAGFPPPGLTGVALCAGQDPCADLDLIEYDLAADCWNCLVPGTEAWFACTATPAIEAIGPVYIGEGSVSPCDGCAAAGAGDLVVRGGQIYTTSGSGINMIGPCTLDGADADTLFLLGGGAVGSAGSRGAAMVLDGNDQVGGGDAGIISGDIADSEITLTCNNLNADGGIHLIQEVAGPGQIRFDVDSLGFMFSAAAGEDVLVEDPVNLYAAATRAETLCNAAFDMTANPSSAFWAGQHGSEMGYYTDGAFTAGCTTSLADGLLVMSPATSEISFSEATARHFIGVGREALAGDDGAFVYFAGTGFGGAPGQMLASTGAHDDSSMTLQAMNAPPDYFANTLFIFNPDAAPPSGITGAFAFIGAGNPLDDVYLGEDVALQFEGPTGGDGFQATLDANPTADRTITLPDASGTVALDLGGQLIRAPQVLTSGTSYTTPADCTRIVVHAWGGGGGGGGCTSAAASCAAGGGGASGGYAMKTYTVTPSTGYTYAIGGAGTGGVNTGGTGLSGGDSTFTDGVTLITAKGGGGGLGMAATTAGLSEGGFTPVSTNGDLNGSGGVGTPGICITGLIGTSGGGGSSALGGGGRPRGAATGAGVAATGLTGGGGGALVENNSGAVAGGDGTAGVIVIYEYAF